MRNQTLAIIALVASITAVALVIHENQEGPFEEAAEEMDAAFNQ